MVRRVADAQVAGATTFETAPTSNRLALIERAGEHLLRLINDYPNASQRTPGLLWLARTQYAMGANAAGFCIENSLSKDLATATKEKPQGPENGEFMLHYQPKQHLASGALAGAEALIRWNHPQHGRLAPRDFIQLAEARGRPLREAVLEAGAVRFRPIALTAAAVVIGGLVMVLDPIFQGLAVALMSGAVVATLLTMIVVPLLYWELRRRQAPAAEPPRPAVPAPTSSARSSARTTTNLNVSPPAYATAKKLAASASARST